MMSCYFCDEIQRIRDNQNNRLVAELTESYVLLKSCELFPGYCLVVSKEHHEQLPELPKERQLALFADVIRVAEAIYSELRPQRINYECLGNLVAHIHWHVVPRYGDDPVPEEPIWKIDKSLRDKPNEESKFQEIRTNLSKRLFAVK